jgi:hypothetical protein
VAGITIEAIFGARGAGLAEIGRPTVRLVVMRIDFEGG